MNRIIFTLVIFLYFFSGLTFSQRAVITGHAFNKQNNEIIPSVLVILNNGEKTDITGVEGSFTFENLDPGTYTLTTRYLGYSSKEQTFQLLRGDSLHLRIELEEETMELPLAVVRSYSLTGGMTQRMRTPGSAYYLPLRSLERFDYTDPGRDQVSCSMCD